MLNLKRKVWRKIGYAVFIPLGLILAVDSFLHGESLRASALTIQVAGALLALPFVRLVGWPFSDASRTCMGILAVAVFMGGKFFEWHLRSGLAYAFVGTLVLLILGSTLLWARRADGDGTTTQA